jgi:hypothetical protein
MVSGIASAWSSCLWARAPGSLTPPTNSSCSASIACNVMCTVRSTGVPVRCRIPTTVKCRSPWSFMSTAPLPWLKVMRLPMA